MKELLELVNLYFYRDFEHLALAKGIVSRYPVWLIHTTYLRYYYDKGHRVSYR